MLIKILLQLEPMQHTIQKTRLHCIFLLILFLAGKYGFTQHEADNWYFGATAAVNFSSGAPVPLTNSAMTAIKGCTTVSDSAGNLLLIRTD